MGGAEYNRALPRSKELFQLLDLVFIDYNMLVWILKKNLHGRAHRVQKLHLKVREHSFEHLLGHLIHLLFDLEFIHSFIQILHFLLDKKFHFFFDPWRVEHYLLHLIERHHVLLEGFVAPRVQEALLVDVEHHCFSIIVTLRGHVGLLM